MIAPIPNQDDNSIIEANCSVLKPDCSLDGKGYIKEKAINSIQESKLSYKSYKLITLADFVIRILIITSFIIDPSSVYNILLFASSLISSLAQISSLIFKCQIKRYRLDQMFLHIVSQLLQFDFLFFSLSNQSKITNKQIQSSLDQNLITKTLKYLVSQFYLKRLFFAIRGLILVKKLIEDQVKINSTDYILIVLTISSFIFTNYLYLKIFVFEKKYNLIDCSLIVLESIISYSFSIMLVVEIFDIGYVSYLIVLIVFSLVVLKLEQQSGKLFDPFKVGTIDQILLGGQISYLLPLFKKDYNSLQMLMNIPLNKIHAAVFFMYHTIVQIQSIMKIAKNEETPLSENATIMYIYFASLILNCSLIICKSAVWCQYITKKKKFQISDFSQINMNQLNGLFYVELTINNKQKQLLEENDLDIIKQLLNFNGGFLSISFNRQFLIQVIKGHIEIIFDYISKREQADKLYLMALNTQKSVNIDIIFEQQSKQQINLFLMTVLKYNILENELKHLQNRQYFINYFKKFNQVQEVIPISQNFNNQIAGATLAQISFLKNVSSQLLNNPQLVCYDLYEDF